MTAVRVGLCSVTLRRLSFPQVIDVAATAGLGRIEWGADLHVPPGDIVHAARVRAAGLDRGVAVASYGSYFRAGPHGPDAFGEVLATAVALGAPRIRIWAGDTGAAQATAEQLRAVTTVTRTVAQRAADAGVRLAFEYHGGTLTDSADAAVALLTDVDHPAVGAYWQPPVGASHHDAVTGLEQVLPWVDAVHVFSWWPGEHRLALDARAALWRSVADVLHGSGRQYDALLEFVRDDDPAQVRTDAATLTELIV